MISRMRAVAGTLAAVVLSSAASAADLPARKSVGMVEPVPVLAWAGFYGGLNAGYASSPHNSVSTVASPLFAGPTWNTELGVSSVLASGANPANASGVIGGVQFGYNFQFSNVVAGVETDFQGIAGTAPGSRTGSGVPAFNPAELITSANSATKRLSYFGTLRARLGYLATPTLLLYATGGLAYGGARASTAIVQLDNSNGVPGNAPYGSFASYSGTRVGWTIGAGGEWMFAPNWSVKAEYLYYDLGSASYGNTLAFVASPVFNFGYNSLVTSKARFNGNIFRLGVNYHFGGSASPVMARY